VTDWLGFLQILRHNMIRIKQAAMFNRVEPQDANCDFSFPGVARVQPSNGRDIYFGSWF